MTERRWTISVLTIPQREEYLKQLVQSLQDSRATRDATLSVVYNWDSRESPAAIESRLRRVCRGMSLEISFNTTEPTIGAGRQQQLNACKTPLICFVDDDVTVHGDLLGALDDTLGTRPIGLLGLPSYVEDTTQRFKPSDTTPSVEHDGLRYTTVQGMLVAGYRRLLLDVGGFNPRRRFWGEWTELNLRMWRLGYPTAYLMDGPYLRHWHAAPESPTRNRSGREMEVLWGLMCTALEYDAVDITADTGPFWRLVADRYLAYAFGPVLPVETLLSSCLQLLPRVVSAWEEITAWRTQALAHPFRFAPFAALSLADVEAVMGRAAGALPGYRKMAFPVKRPWLLPRLGASWRALRSA